MWFVYLVRCQDSTLYTGMTNNVEQRLAKHNRGKGARYTRTRRPVQLVYQEIQASRSLALKREYAIKGLSRREKESLIQKESTPHCEWKPGDSSLAR
ncbi:MAG: GIY-YIG nuclease family protein [Planctomycetota bacterium]|nr:MAG: GIY-YIG nuclease family protein [Planctomycetota bacterium]